MTHNINVYIHDVLGGPIGKYIYVLLEHGANFFLNHLKGKFKTLWS